MHRFYLPNIAFPAIHDLDNVESQLSISLDSPIIRQLKTVLRIETGDRIRLFNGSGSEWEVEIDRIGNNNIVARSIVSIEPVAEPSVRITVLLGLARAERIELAIQKCTELGAARFQPVISERVQGGNTGSPSANRLERWQRIAVEATEQCGRATVPVVEAPVPIMEAVAAEVVDRPLFCMWEAQSDLVKPLRTALQSCHDVRELAFLVGPPGGFGEQEAVAIRDAGAVLVSLGPRVLRSETAAIAVMSAILYEFDDLGG
ncbi:MAG: 16S rRNA (uracil(1498)-N(3))-methyltransferase [Chloroflexi bacterium]|nr:16S rRNA (uracil(1498)-N(3))-methyltransferase [Chloroflexota bacterium]